MNVLVFGLTNNSGGIETMFMEYYRVIHGNGINFDFVTYFNGIAFEEEITGNGSRLYKVSNPKRHPIKYRRQIEEILKKGNYDSVYVNMLSAANVVPLQLAKKANVRAIAHSHNNSIPKGIIRKICHYNNKRKIVRLSDERVACSEEAGNWLFGKGVKYKVLNNLIDENKFRYKKELKDLFRRNKNDYIVGHIGRFCEQKNQKMIIRLAKKIHNEDKTIKFVLVGTGAKKYISKRVLSKCANVSILDGSENICDVYSGFDLFIFPSKFEGFGMAAVEAQVNGLKCLLSDALPAEVVIADRCKRISIKRINEWKNEILAKPSRDNKKSFLTKNYFVSIDRINMMKNIIKGENE